ncbi:MAG: alpha-glucan family phosphorylase [Gammaproteobacteria bacterium]|nr:MAG: alpha-glucan family phosphorylase [Gammaproteobacteria bacterium]
MTGRQYPLEVRPVVPAALARLEELAGNLLYSWDRRVRGLYYRLDPELWDRCQHNPKVFLRRVAQQRLDESARDPYYLRDYNDAVQHYDAYFRATEQCYCAIDGMRAQSDVVAYFCMEYGLHESLRLYSGGLGVLAGDHCKAASDLGLPFVAVGLMYRQGYFGQTISADGSQQAHFHPMDLADLPIRLVTDDAGRELRIPVQFPGRTVQVQAWQADVGQVRLFLLDTDVEGNGEADRAITYQLYGGDRTNRIGQELVLGLAGVRLLRLLGLQPAVWHINEGHAGFLILERCREAVAAGLDFEAALELVAAATVFTTHTPVPAGHDLFAHDLAAAHLQGLAAELGLPLERLLALGDSPQNGHHFNMTALSLRGSRFQNGVSAIHGRVAARMESYIWPQIEPEDNPLQHITNGVHVPTFLAREWCNLFDARSPGWFRQLADTDFWRDEIESIPDNRFWNLRLSLKSEMLEGVRELLLRQYQRNQFGRARIDAMRTALAPENTRPLVLGFARRFATYKRALLLFHDPPRLARLLNDPARPVLVLFAGKAHPQDGPGQEMIRQINALTAQPEFLGKLFFVEDYDLALARKLVTGTDVWLNTPQYPLEASGTSGQKVAINGGLNLSVLDGWWAEGHNGSNGWGIPPHDEQADPAVRDRLEAEDLLDILERDVIPLYFDHGPQGFNERWVAMSKSAMRSILPHFSAHRMVTEYANRLYGPAIRDGRRIDAAAAGTLARWKAAVRGHWSGVSLRWQAPPPAAVRSGEPVTLQVAAQLDGLSPEDVRLECLLDGDPGAPAEGGRAVHPFTVSGRDEASGATLFTARFAPPEHGLHHFRVHLYPWHELLSHPFEVGLRLWL